LLLLIEMIDRELALSKAQEWQEREPFDAGHDWEHHKEVINNCLWIVEQEKLEDKIDLDVLLVAAAWHDFRRGSEDYSVLKSELLVQGVDQEFISKVIETISGHSFGESQTNIEGKVLFDADKMAYLSPSRILRVLSAVENGEMKKETMSRYGYHFRERIPKIPDLLNFQGTKQQFARLLSEYRKFVESTPALNEFVV